MNLDPLSFALSEISYTIANLTKKNYKQSVAAITSLVNQYGAEADRHLFRCLFSHIDFSGDGKSSGKDLYQIQYLSQEFSALLTKPNFISILCYSIDNPLQQQNSLKPSAHLFSQISRVLRLTRVQEVAVGLALLSSSKADIVNFALQFAKQKLPELIRSYVDVDTGRQEGGLQDSDIEILHLLLSHLVTERDQLGIAQETLDTFLKTVRREFPRERVPAIISPFVYPTLEDIAGKKLRDLGTMKKNMTDISIADLMLESGYGCTNSVEECRSLFNLCGAREVTSVAVARTLGMMARTPTTLGDHVQQTDRPEIPGVSTWNVDVFFQIIKEMNPHLNWREVVTSLDYPKFIVSSKKGLRLLIQAIHRGLGQEPFPIDLIYKPWNNTEGQLSFLTQALKYPDVFCLADFKGDTPSVTIDILKSAPNEDDREISTWKCLSLIETLLRLSDNGHHAQVFELFKAPIAKCPDILVLALLQITPTVNRMKQEIISSLMPVFLGQHSNSAVILHYAWHHQGHSSSIRTLIMHSMAEWYMRGEPHDQVRLSRILDVAQDLKALSMLLNASPYAFVIDLACLASRREYLKLDKWLNDKITDHKESFIQACVTFLKRRCPQLMGLPVKEEQPQARSQQLPSETVFTMLNCLRVWTMHLNPELADAINTMLNNASVYLTKARAAPAGPMQALGHKQPQFPAQNIVNQLDNLNNIGGVLSQPGPVGPPGAQNLPQAIASLSLGPPGSPSKSFQPMSQPNAAGMNFNPMMNNQMSTGLGMQAPMTQAIGPGPTSAGPGPRPPVSNLAALGPANTSTPKLGLPISQERLGNRTVQSGNPASDMSNIFPEMTQTFSKEVEDKANTYFQQIYNQPPAPTMSIDEVLAMLKNFKDSMDKTNRDVFACMLRNLFEEYRFFPQYPDRELKITAQLFGGIIEQNIVTYWTLGIALRYILEALRKQPNTNMYHFGMNSLERFKTKLKEYPQYCQHLAQIPHFMQLPAHLIEYVEYGARSQEPPHPQMPHGMMSELSGRPMTPVSLLPGLVRPPPNDNSSNVPPPSLTAGPSLPASTPQTTVPTQSTAAPIAAPTRGATFAKPSIATATNIDTLLAGQGNNDVMVPSEAIQDKVFFIFNNLSLANMNQKAEELKEVMGTDYISWVAQYLVMKRASIEPNFHTLYSNFVDVLGIESLTSKVITETFRNIKVLLRSDKGVANFSDRTLLKNLGHWLGMLTLAKCKPILTMDLNLKALIYEAYQKGNQELLYVVPFSAKVLESCAKSKIFCKPNPWTLSIMNVLAELHQEPDLKLNLKFEIEVLCKTLNIDIATELKPTKYLRDPTKMAVLEHQLSPVKPPEDPVSATMPQQPTVLTMPPMAGMPPIHNLPVLPPPPPNIPPPPAVVPLSAGPGAGVLPLQPKFSIHDINTNTSLAAFLQQHFVINEQVLYIQANISLRNSVIGAIESTMQDFVVPITERAIKVAVATTEQIVKKDFALDADEIRMRNAAQAMARNVCAGLALITSREPMVQQLKHAIQSALASNIRGQNPAQLKGIEDSAVILANDNVEICANYIQKLAVERVGGEMDKKLAPEYEARKITRQEGRRYYDPQVLTYQNDRVPDQISLKVGSITSQQMAVYDEFARHLPGFQPLTDIMLPSGARQTSTMSSQEELSHLYEKMVQEIDNHMHMMANPAVFIPHLQQLMQAINVARNTLDKNTATQLVQKAIEGLSEQYTLTTMADGETLLRFRECHLLVLKTFAEHRAFGMPWVSKEVTRCLMQSREDNRYNLDVVELLIRNGFVMMPQYDLYLASLMENGLNQIGINFTTQLMQRLCVDDKSRAPQQIFSESDFTNSIEALSMIGSRSRQTQPESLPALIESLRVTNTSADSSSLMDRVHGSVTSMMQTGITQAREFDDPAGLHEKTEYLLREWVNMYHSPQAGRDSFKAFNAFVQQMHTQGILKTDDLITRFFRLCTEMCVDLCYRALSEPGQSTTMIRAKCFHTLDAFVRLIALLVKHSGETNTVTKINLLNKVLGIMAGVLLQDHEVRYTEFQQLPYHRIFIMLFIELNAPEPILEAINFQVLTAFCHVFHILRPAKAPGFAYAWLELISHRVFIGRLLALTPHQKGWGFYAQLLVDLFKFLGPFLRNAEMTKPMQLLYKGTLRVLLVLLHDFPEFLCDYHYTFCDVIPPNCIQMRNLILSAFPRTMRLPDPFTVNLVVEHLPDINRAPRILTNIVSLIQPATFKKDLDSYLKSRSPITFLSELKSNLQANPQGCRYDIPLINALVLYVGTQAIPLLLTKGVSMSTIAPSSHMDIFQNLAVNLDTEGRYLFLTAIANQLRYPNSHTHYFSCALLYLFRQANDQTIQEQITRVLLERLIVNRPHPWGLLITFIELIKNPSYKFWEHEFVRCAPEIEKLFENVARSCYQQRQQAPQQNMQREETQVD
ncbi:CCR4-NOT transcription complex subunit 1-like isoform X2 [Biomphalaria glabrata]|uniref:CCR4-NOT transcription complex subunit 1 n=1 Tax=Biomphalaria glabrata TaxID=6526 RepID=A0A9W3AU77_BIOGL|nr:CCR4-NOT transcription complex subunit 1-like isoform X2 [Biomphalaria glabrata]KAI8761958.1 CCR4-NOT transcription complex subunit 1-like [Biomphalaria glabrata]